MKTSDIRDVPVSVLIRFALVAWFMWLCVAPVGWAQSQNVASIHQPAEEQSVANQSTAAGWSAAEANAMVPRLIKFSGTLLDPQGKPIATGPVGVTFALYAEQTGGASLWLETQNVRPDENGYYTVLLGSETSTGVPMELFATGEARWLGIQIERQPEQSRVLLVSVPYALKAGDAQTLGGRPASDFALANPSSVPSATETSSKSESVPATSASSTSVSKNAAPPSNPTVTGKGVLDHIPMWDTASDIVDSVIFQKSTDIGIGTVTPAATLDVNGKEDIRDTLTLFPKGTDSTLAVNGTAFKVDQTGKVTFVSTQTFPGASAVTANNSTEALSVTQTGTGAAAVFNVTKSTDTIIKAELNGSAVFSVGASGGLYDSQQLFTSGTIANDAFIVSPTGAVSTLNSDVANGATAITANQNDSNNSDVTFGLNASTSSSGGIAVLGTAGPGSVFATQAVATGVWGDAGSQYSTGVQGSANDGIAIAAYSDSGTDTIEPTLFAYNGSSAAGALVFKTNSANVKICTIDVFANLACNGSKSAVVPVGDGQKMVALYAVESPENWFEDYGSEHLENGAATVTLDPTYAQTVNTGMEYHVFLTPGGDCNGLYVTNKTANSFEVRELKGGHSNITFDYRIIAKRNGYEQIRLADKTAMMKAVPTQVARLGRKPAAKAPSDGSAPARLP